MTLCPYYSTLLKIPIINYGTCIMSHTDTLFVTYGQSHHCSLVSYALGFIPHHKLTAATVQATTAAYKHHWPQHRALSSLLQEHSYVPSCPGRGIAGTGSRSLHEHLPHSALDRLAPPTTPHLSRALFKRGGHEKKGTKRMKRKRKRRPRPTTTITTTLKCSTCPRPFERYEGNRKKQGGNTQ